MAEIFDVILFSNEKDAKSTSNFASLLKLLLHRICNNDIPINIIHNIGKEKQLIASAKAVVILVNPDDITNKTSDVKSLISNSDIQSKLFIIFNSDISTEQKSELALNSTAYTFSDSVSSNTSKDNSEFLRMLDLAYDITSLIVPEKETKKQKGEQIFFAAVTSEQEANRDIIKRELKQFGYTATQLRNAYSDSEKIKSNVEKYLSKSNVAIHLFGNSYGSVLKNQDISLPEYHNKIASDYINNLPAKEKNSAVYRFLWIQPNSKFDSEKQKIFIEQLKRDISSLVNAEILQVPIEDFKSIIRKKLLQENIPQQDEIDQKNMNEKKVYLIHEKKDIEKLKSIADTLSSSGYKVIYTDFQENANIVEVHRQNLVNSQAFIIYHSGKNDFWINSKIKDIIKAPGYGQTEPFLAKAVFIENGAPSTLPDDFLIIKNEKSSASALLKPFFEKLK